MNKKNILVWNSIAIIVMLFFCSCENNIQKVNELTQNYDSLPDQVSKNIEMLYSQKAGLQLKLQAPEMHRYFHKDNAVDEFPKGVRVIFYNPQKEPDTQMQANYAINYLDKGEMVARNDVVIVNRNGEKLNTEHIVWNKKEEKIRSTEFVKITTADEIIYGDGLESNQDFTQYKILNIKGIINIKDEGFEEDTLQTSKNL